MSKQNQQPQKRPDPQPTPELPEVRTLALGETKDRQSCVLWITTQGRRVLSRELCFVGYSEKAERVWLGLATEHFWERKPWDERAQARAADRSTGHTLDDVKWAHGLGFRKDKTTWSTVEVHVEGEEMTEGPAVWDATTDSLLAWECFVLRADKRLLSELNRRAA